MSSTRHTSRIGCHRAACAAAAAPINPIPEKPMNTNVAPVTAANGQNILLVGGCGYIGSSLYPRLKAAGFSVTVCDLLRRGNPLGLSVLNRDYDELSAQELAGYDAVLWFGGHSSVGQSIEDPNGAIGNNCLNLFSMAKRLSPHTKLIYASSGSLYSRQGSGLVPASESQVAQIPSQNAYDISKFAFDYLASNFLGNFYALRMGTLAGFSPNLRQELVFNAMNLAAVRTGKVHLKNSESCRTILFLDDLWCLINKLLVTQQQPGIFNAGSQSFTMGELANAIASTWNAQVIFEGESPTYSFLLDTTRMRAICGNDLPTTKFAQRCTDFVDACQQARLVDRRTVAHTSSLVHGEQGA
jgi:nucleoside-diphosphate-sugar epimerase